ncbi:chemotaxis protein CheW [Azotosporobacter soli]|uniref:chemotaxis protein CheW n=1 Tax=Azotosporobacter soli TaxID=3055040 RepID=UPI0031FEFA7E
MSKQFVVFSINEEEYGFDVSAVNGILRAKKFTIKTMPGTSKVIEGIINVRNSINYVLNLRHKFGLVPREMDEESKFIMLNIGESNACCIADEVTDIMKLEEEDIQAAPTFVSGISAKYIEGIGKMDERIIIILNPQNILNLEERVSIEEAAAAAK